MARQLKPYKGFAIEKESKTDYWSYDARKNERFHSESLSGIKKRIDRKIDIANLAVKFGL